MHSVRRRSVSAAESETETDAAADGQVSGMGGFLIEPESERWRPGAAIMTLPWGGSTHVLGLMAGRTRCQSEPARGRLGDRVRVAAWIRNQRVRINSGGRSSAGRRGGVGR